ncbi:uncharacterized protein METZ01_LOCUS276076, partial [marine metagenome]
TFSKHISAEAPTNRACGKSTRSRILWRSSRTPPRQPWYSTVRTTPVCRRTRRSSSTAGYWPMVFQRSSCGFPAQATAPGSRASVMRLRGTRRNGWISGFARNRRHRSLN